MKPKNKFMVRLMKEKPRREWKLADYEYPYVVVRTKQQKYVGPGVVVVSGDVVNIDDGGEVEKTWAGFRMNHKLPVWKMLSAEEQKHLEDMYKVKGDRAVIWGGVGSNVQVRFADVQALVQQLGIKCNVNSVVVVDMVVCGEKQRGKKNSLNKPSKHCNQLPTLPLLFFSAFLPRPAISCKMVRPKAPRKKQQQRGVDFKKIKRKIGRKLPPPKNATSTEIKSKAIILPEQSVASEKAGLAVSKKGLTLKELLQQTSHHNSKVRKDALIGIRDIFLKYPTELRLHKLAVIEKLRERISDDDKLVRETLYQLLKSVIFPTCKEDNQGPFISLMMAYIFNAMTHLAIDVRLMAFKFFDLVVQYYPLSFSLYSEKIFQNYEYVLRKNQFYLQDKGKLKNVLAGLVHCLLLLPSNKADHDSPCEKDDDKYFAINILITEIFLHTTDWQCPAALLEKFLEFVACALSEEICSGTESGKAFHEKHILSLIPFIPKLVLQVAGFWKSRILQAFTETFKSCNLESSLKWVCLSAIEQMLVPRQGLKQLDASDPELLDYQITWMRELPLLLIMLDDKHPLRSSSVLSLLLRLGQCAVANTFFAQEYDNMQDSLAEFYCNCMGERNISYGPFVKLDRDAQEFSICCLYYFSHVDSLLLKSLAWCCLYDGLEPIVIFRIIEVLHSSYKAGHIQIADHISFFVTLLSCFKVYAEKSCPMLENDEISNCGIFKSITRAVCSCLLQMGDYCLVFQILEKVVLDQITLNPALDNLCALLRMLVALDARPTRFSQQSIINLSNFLPGYLIDVVSCFPEDDDESRIPVLRSTRHYYFLPCYILFYRSNKLLNLVLRKMGSLVTEKSRITAIVSVVLLMHKDVKVWKILSSCKTDIDFILQSILVVQSSEEDNMVLEERHKIQNLPS
ncbi:Testis-expressed protein 10 [Camellia lanceoleosa]|uniref:Testis-expressed protein 10 n=1 Tax=Camellia lanceoleosa TaxID=1840588 RepID=A0ACC0FRX6_9ERIC|nr:Testis-expressed protein 10 [Camellia lanceoleosa]